MPTTPTSAVRHGWNCGPRPSWPCGGCGRLIAWELFAAARGVARAGSRDLCTRCYWHRRRKAGLTRARYIRGTLIQRPSHDVDPIAVERLLGGDYRTPTTAEVHEAVMRLDRLGWSASRIAIRLRCTARTVQRHRARARAERQEVAA